MKFPNVVTVAQLAGFDEVIDVRSPAEFAEDHLPGAINCPVLDDAERAAIGTMYKQLSPFDAKKRGAALVAKNIARHIEEKFAAHGRNWRPLVYCWRGGKRSGAMAHILSEIGWHAAQLEGADRAYRREILAQLGTLPQRLRFAWSAAPPAAPRAACCRRWPRPARRYSTWRNWPPPARCWANSAAGAAGTENVR